MKQQREGVFEKKAAEFELVIDRLRHENRVSIDHMHAPIINWLLHLLMRHPSVIMCEIYLG